MFPTGWPLFADFPNQNAAFLIPRERNGLRSSWRAILPVRRDRETNTRPWLLLCGRDLIFRPGPPAVAGIMDVRGLTRATGPAYGALRGGAPRRTPLQVQVRPEISGCPARPRDPEPDRQHHCTRPGPWPRALLMQVAIRRRRDAVVRSASRLPGALPQ